MKKYKVGVCGYFDTENTIPNGQTIKTISVTNELKAQIGDENVKIISTYSWKKKPLILLFDLILLAVNCENVIILPDYNGAKIIIPISIFLKNIFKCKVFYIVIGGWLPDSLKKRNWLLGFVKKLDGIFVETITLQRNLNDLLIKKVYLFPNFKNMRIQKLDERIYNYKKPFKICYFSRVIAQKGIEELIDIIKCINNENKEIIYLLDIYGPVDKQYTQRFDDIKENLPNYIKYNGVIDSFKTTEVLKDYFLQVFPTKFKTEGFPGSILDSFSAGVPVIASQWNSWSDIINEGINGITFEFGNFKDLYRKLKHVSENPLIITKMKSNCIESALEYCPERVIQILINELINI